jgi:hypothetical protein
MMAATTLRRMRTMTPGELRFRASRAARTWRDRVRHRIRAPSWDRRALVPKLSRESGALQDAAGWIRAGRWPHAEEMLARHFSSRSSPWPIEARDREPVTRAIGSRFPAASADAAARADRLVEGRYDLLGYRNLPYGASPDWHLDVVHGRTAPRAFWADVPYLDPACGDHKVTWELNRHQHWMSLGRAFWLTGDAIYARTFLDQLYSWLDANPPLSGVNWASMLELAFRTISWTWTLEFFAGIDTTIAGGRPWRIDLLLALDRQLSHIAANLSRYFSPNTHLSGEALALYVVSLAFPELRESTARAARGRDLLLRETRRQILPDGGHAERSTHYHRYSTDFYLLATIVARRAGDPAAAQLAASASAQADVLRTLADENGALQTIGDDDGGQLFAICGTPPRDVRTTLAVAAAVLSDPALAVSAPTEESCWVAGTDIQSHTPDVRPPASWRSRLLPDSGYFVSRARGELAIFDAGAHGFLNGGHAHADALAIITTVGGTPLLIDPGTGTYTMDPGLRDRLRSGRLHNTVLVDGREHAIVGGPFHWTSTTDAGFLAAHVDERCDVAQGVHDGYADVRHVRTLLAIHGIGWLVVDQLLGSGAHRAESFWHVHPSWTTRPCGSTILLRHAEAGQSSITSTAEIVEVMDDSPDAICAPEYGRVEPAPLIRTVKEGPAPLIVATFVAAGAAAASDVAIGIDPCRVAAEWDGVAVHLTTGHVDIRALVAAPWRHARGAQGGAWPGVSYGTSNLQSNGRAAILVRSAATTWHAIVDGTELRTDSADDPRRQQLNASPARL